MLWNRIEKVTVAFTFSFQSDAALKGSFAKIQGRPIPSECSVTNLPDGKVLLRITRRIDNSESVIASNRDELISDLKGYGAIFKNWKYHLVGVKGKTENKNITTASKFLAWLTPASDTRNYRSYAMPFYSIIFVLILGLIIIWVA